MTKKDYLKIIEAIYSAKKYVDGKDLSKEKCLQQHNGISEVVIRLTEVLKKDNPKFNSNKFVEACNK